MDSFTDKPFSGNPAAVCLLNEDLSAEKKQSISAEMNLSETSFVRPKEGNSFGSSTEFFLQWFTPTCEVPLCGHATMATAAVLFTLNDSLELSFHTLSGVLSVSRDGGYIRMTFPLANLTLQDDWSDVEEVIKLSVGSLPIEKIAYSSSTKKLLLHLEDTVELSSLVQLRPDTAAMQHAHEGRVRGVIITIRGSDGYDFYSRYFAPWNGIPEDPVTGSAHTVLANYWGTLLRKDELVARQCSARGGDVKMKLLADNQKVILAGKAFIVMKGALLIP